MKLRYSIFAGLVIASMLFSCNNNAIKVPEKPKDLIGEKAMVDLLYDMAVVTAAKGSNKKVLENNGIFPEAYIFKKYAIDSVQFAKSNEYYSYKPDVYESIYAKVLERLNKEKAIHQKVLDAEKKVKDSLAKVKKKESDSLAKIRKQKRDSIKKANPNSKNLQSKLEKKTKDLLEKVEQ